MLNVRCEIALSFFFVHASRGTNQKGKGTEYDAPRIITICTTSAVIALRLLITAHNIRVYFDNSEHGGWSLGRWKMRLFGRLKANSFDVDVGGAMLRRLPIIHALC